MKIYIDNGLSKAQQDEFVKEFQRLSDEIIELKEKIIDLEVNKNILENSMFDSINQIKYDIKKFLLKFEWR